MILISPNLKYGGFKPWFRNTSGPIFPNVHRTLVSPDLLEIRWTPDPFFTAVNNFGNMFAKNKI
jgi:hypothetical protein